jgi:hypothetical protein
LIKGLTLKLPQILSDKLLRGEEIVMKIEVGCLCPKYAIGEYELHSLEELFQWLTKIKGVPKSYIYGILYDMAIGELRKLRERDIIYFKSDIGEQLLAQEVAAEVERMHPEYKTRKKDDKARLEEALAFARNFDKAIAERNYEI